MDTLYTAKFSNFGTKCVHLRTEFAEFVKLIVPATFICILATFMCILATHKRVNGSHNACICIGIFHLSRRFSSPYAAHPNHIFNRAKALMKSDFKAMEEIANRSFRHVL
jgi:hypothetical protein